MSFNPHSRMGSDESPEIGLLAEYSFNPHSRMGSDKIVHVHLIYEKKFQSTLPHGE